MKTNIYLFRNTFYLPVDNGSYLIEKSTVIPRKVKPKYKNKLKKK